MKDLVTDKEFKSYDDLKNRLEKVLGLNGEVIAPKTTVETIKEQAKANPNKFKEPEIASDDDDMAYFSKLAEEE